MYLRSSGIRRFCFGEWSLSSGYSYEWDLFLKVGEMGPEEASKLLVQTEMYVSKYTCKGRHRSSITSMNKRLDHSYWTSGKEKGLILLRERILNN
ncbi:hypothetical protein ACOSQ2_003199 [Xanthoceras sorbifolium]